MLNQTFDRSTLFAILDYIIPRLLQFSLSDTHHRHAVLVFDQLQVDIQRLPHGHLSPAGNLVPRDKALSLIADIKQNPIVLLSHDNALNNGAFSKRWGHSFFEKVIHAGHVFQVHHTLWT